jgi:hypothetical protein
MTFLDENGDEATIYLDKMTYFNEKLKQSFKIRRIETQKCI